MEDYHVPKLKPGSPLKRVDNLCANRTSYDFRQIITSNFFGRLAIYHRVLTILQAFQVKFDPTQTDHLLLDIYLWSSRIDRVRKATRSHPVASADCAAQWEK
jgi:hypothetical protein